ncbi:zinc-dependent alcohol dehydrogenase family protein [Roseateles saccharophilus]|nr:zinc-dependent alcohol dehydrogenase family protein [Roseateles saccharophilus]
MQAMVLGHPKQALQLQDRPLPEPPAGEVRLRVLACAVCRTDLHVIDGELPQARYPIVPGHEIVGEVEALGPGADGLCVGQIVGLPWLGGACCSCRYCIDGDENLCDRPQFTGCSRDGGFATHVLARAAFCLPLGASQCADPEHTAPLLCAGLIGWRALRAAGDGARVLGLYGFGAAAHLIAQVAAHQGRKVFAFTRAGDTAGQQFALSMGASWAGGSGEAPPEPVDAALIFAPAGELVPQALQAVRKGGRVVCGGIHMSDIPSFPYRLLWEERRILSVANLTRQDGREFLAAAARLPLRVRTTRYALADANAAVGDLRAGRLNGAAVLVP